MATYKAKPVHIGRSAEYIAGQFSDLTRLQSALDALPETERSKVGDVQFTADSIVMRTAQVGEIRFKVKERTPLRVAFEAGGLPMPMIIAADIEPKGDSASEVTASLDIDIPAVLRPMVGGAMQKAVDRFAELIAGLTK